MRIITKKAVEAFKANRAFQLDNTEVKVFKASSTWAGPESATSLYLFGHEIARKNHATGLIYITTAGWNTPTTKERLNGIPGVNVYAEAGQLYLNGIVWSGDWKAI